MYPTGVFRSVGNTAFGTLLHIPAICLALLLKKMTQKTRDENLAISVKNLSKMYRIYDSPKDRLKEIFYPFKKKRHTEFWALKGISFDIDRGEAFGIIGRNGSGKSTLLQIICGILQKTSGKIVKNGRISALLELGTGFDPEFTGRQNVYMNGALMGLTREDLDIAIDDILGFAEIGDFIDQPMKFYSSGMYIRLAFSCAVNMKPDILIVDEALSVGDVFFQQKCFKLIKEIIQRGTTCIFVSHDTTTIMNLCSRSLLLVNGQTEYVGPSSSVVSRYFSRYKKTIAHDKENYIKTVSVDDGLPKEEEIIENNVLPANGVGHGAGGILIKALRVTNEFGQESHTVHMLKPLNFDLLLVASEFIEAPSTNIHIYDRLGNNLFSCGSHLIGEQLPELKEGESLVVRMTVNFNLRAAEYTYSVGVGEPLKKGLHDRREHLGPIFVTENFKNNPPFHGMAKLPFKVWRKKK